MDEYKIIDGYENYTISAKGEVYNIKYNRLLKPYPNKRDGYLKVELCSNGKGKTFLVHRLVAHAFIDNEDDKPYINHIDSDRSNNIVSNLEWCTPEENVHHSMKMGRFHKIVSRIEWEEFQEWKRQKTT